MSTGLQEFCLYFCNRMSFAKVAKLVERVSGERLAHEQTLRNWTQEKARKASAALRSEVAATRSLSLPAVDREVDVYDERVEEVLVMTDAIQVKAQKPTRQRASERRNQEEEEKAKRKRGSTDLMLVQGRDGSLRYLSEE